MWRHRNVLLCILINDIVLLVERKRFFDHAEFASKNAPIIGRAITFPHHASMYVCVCVLMSWEDMPHAVSNCTVRDSPLLSLTTIWISFIFLLSGNLARTIISSDWSFIHLFRHFSFRRIAADLIHICPRFSFSLFFFSLFRETSNWALIKWSYQQLHNQMLWIGVFLHLQFD